MLTWPALRLASSLLAISCTAASIGENPRESRSKICSTITSSSSFFWLGSQSHCEGLPARRSTRVVRGMSYIAAAHRTLGNWSCSIAEIARLILASLEEDNAFGCWCIAVDSCRVRFWWGGDRLDCPIDSLVEYVTALSFSFNLSSFNYLAFSVPALGLYINFYSEVLYFLYCSLLENFGYFFLAYYLVIFLLNAV